MCKYLPTYIYIWVYTRIRSHMCTYICIYMCTYIHTYAWYLSFLYQHTHTHVTSSMCHRLCLIHTCVNLRVSICRADVTLCLFFRCSVPSFAAPQRAAILRFKEQSRARGSGSAAASLSCSCKQPFCGTLRGNMGHCEIWGAFYESFSLVPPCVLVFFWLKHIHVCKYAYMYMCKCTYT